MGNKQSRKKVLPSPPPRGVKPNEEVKLYHTETANESGNVKTPTEYGDEMDLSKYKYPFECAVFEGGGAKGVAYVGVVRELENAGVWPQMKRIAGTSAGAMTATMVCLGYNSYELEHFLNTDMKKVVLDARLKGLSFIPNFIRNFGWHPGKRLLKWFRDNLERSTGEKNLTFLQLYKMTGMELCIVVCNVNQLDAEYCHPKTTPDMEIATAIRMSMSIPVLFEAVRYQGPINNDLYVDGGLLCNFPLHAFDGWYLSMAKEDSFMRKLQPLSDLPLLFDRNVRFGSFNEKTLGFLLYAGHEQDVLRTELESRTDVTPQPRPDTPLARFRTEEESKRVKMEEEHFEVVTAADRFMRALTRNNLDQDDNIDREELKNALEKSDSKFTKAHRELLFGKGMTIDQVLDIMDIDKNGEISYHELVKFIEKKGVHIQSRFRGYERREVRGVMSFFVALQDTLLVNVKRIFIQKRDVERTIGINTDYIDTNDYDMEVDDKKFLVEQGARATKSYLRHYVQTKNPQKIVEESPETLEKSPENTTTKHIGNNDAEDRVPRSRLDPISSPPANLESSLTPPTKLPPIVKRHPPADTTV